MFVALTVPLQLSFQSGAPTWTTVWAEDGSVFLQGALDRGLRTVVESYAGYLQMVPRILALPMRAFPIESAAVYFAVVASLTTSLIALSVYFLTAGSIRSTTLRWVLAAAVAVRPVLAFENMATIALVSWPLAFAGFWAIVFEPRRRRETTLAASMAFLGVASASFALLYAPVVLAYLVVRRTRARMVVAVAYGTGALIQALVVLTADDRGPTGAADGLARLFAARVLSVGVIGEQATSELFEAHGWTPVLVFAGLAGIGIVAALLRARTEARLLGGTLLAFGVFAWFVPLTIRGTADLELTAGRWSHAAARHAGLAIVFVLGGVFVLVTSGSSAAVRRGLPVAFAVQLLVLIVVAFPFENLRSLGPRWKPELRRAARACASAPSRDRKIVEIPITPGGGWFVDLRCRTLADVRG